jgi:hypothetical protein
LKPKYYPHITILGAIALTALPLAFVMSLSYLRSSSDFDAVIAGEAHALEQRRTIPTQDDLELALADELKAAPAAAATPGADTRVAMLPPHAAESRTLDVAPIERSAPVQRTASADRVANVRPQSLDVSTDAPAIREEAVPVPVRTQVATNDAVSAKPVAVQPDVAMDSPTATEHDDAREAELAILNAEMNTALTTRPVEKPTAYFESTGHLAMIPPPRATNNGNRPAAPVKQETTARKDSKRRPRGAEAKSAASAPVEATSSFGSSESGSWPVDVVDDGFGTNAATVLEDVILQQPLENRPVGRVENVVAVTRAKGWPIALVRSDLPDDFWWVQQMVGIRGNAFAARANFGNEESIPGSAYHMVIVFLDSPEEVLRFRIAKRFTDLPEGCRHSREFTFVRQ